MAHFGKEVDDFKGSRSIHIRSAEQTEQFTLYIITVTVGSYSWTVKHRYSEFYELHEKLTASYKLDKSLLPPKKIFGNQSESFIKKRQRELEIYLQTITLYLAQHVPSCLAYFLDFDKYEIHGITQAMAEDLYERGEALLFSREPYEVTSLQLYSLTERLKLPEPTCESGDVKKDLGHILDFITRCKHLKVKCQPEPVGTSNILMNKVPFDLTLFKSLQTMSIQGCNMQLILGLEIVKQTLTRLEIHDSTSSLKEVLLQDAQHWRAEDGAIMVGYWHLVTHVDFSHNSFQEIHESVQLLPNTEYLDLSHNCLENIQNLQWLSQLTQLDLSHNYIKNLDSLHTKLGNLKSLCISHNRLEHLHGFAKLFSLQSLDISHNNISTIQELLFVSQLPCVEELIVTGNPVTQTLDYRTKTLAMFGDRVREVILDQCASDQKELDTVAVLQALQKAKNVKLVKKSFQSKNPSALSLSDMYGNDLTDGEGRSSRTSSPALGNVSRSVPMPGIVFRTSSPSSQASVKSSGSQQEDAQTVSPTGHTVSPGGGGAMARLSEDALSVISEPAQEGTDMVNDDEDMPVGEFEQVPEAHPFDLGFENLAGGPISVQIPASSEKPSSSAKSPQRLLNKLSSSPKYTEIRRAGVKSKRRSSAGLDKNVADEETEQHQQQSREENGMKKAGDGTSSQMRMKVPRNSVSDLPGMSSPEFVAWLGEQLLDCSSSSNAGVGWIEDKANASLLAAESSRPRADSIVDILWCYCEQLSHPNVIFPCCVILTRDKVVLERLMLFPGMAQACEGGGGRLPGALRPCSILPISSIQQLVLGPCFAFLRLEEAFVGHSGTYTVFAVEPHGLKRFVERMLQVCRDLGDPVIPDIIDLSARSDLLHQIAAWEEKVLGLTSDRLAVVILVKQASTQNFSFLVLSENQVYCLDTAFIHWPPPSFDTAPASTSISVNMLHAFSATDRISKINILPLTGTGNYSVCSDPAASPQTRVAQAFPFLHYQLDLEVTFSSVTSPASLSPVSESSSVPIQQHQTHPTSVSYLFVSAAHRDLFLDRLTNLRVEHAHRMSPTVREEPEGGNELTPVAGNHHDRIATVMMEGAGRDLPFELEQKKRGSKGEVPAFKPSGKGLEDDATSTGSNRSATSGDNTVYYSASPSENLSVSPMSNFSRASISPPSSSQQSLGKRNLAMTVTHVVSVEAETETGGHSHGREADEKKHFSGVSSESQADLEVKAVVTAKATDPLKNTSPNKDPIVVDTTSFSRLDFGLSYSSLLPPNSETIEASEVDKHLQECLKSYNLIQPLPPKLKPLHLMGGRDLRRFFHAVVKKYSKLESDHKNRTKSQPQKEDDEELRHVLWTSVIPYTNPRHEQITLVMVSSQSVYLVSDNPPAPSHKSRPSWMTHTRNSSDSAFAWKSAAITSTTTTPAFASPSSSLQSVPHLEGLINSSGDAASSLLSSASATTSSASIITSSRNVVISSSKDKEPMVKPFFCYGYKDIKRIDVGVFDQCVRLTGCDANSVFALVIRDSSAVETLLHHLKEMLTLSYSKSATSSQDGSGNNDDGDEEDPHSDLYWDGSDEHDFYRQDIHRTKSTVEGLVYMHPSKVKFVYPGQEAIGDILFLVNQEAGESGSKAKTGGGSSINLLGSSLWIYILCHQLPVLKNETSSGVAVTPGSTQLNSQPRSVILTETHFALSQDDLVTYPLPDFVRGLPETPCHQIVECRPIQKLKRVCLFHSDPHKLALTFVDEILEDIVVDTTVDHFGGKKLADSLGGRGRQQGGRSPETTVVLYIQSLQDKDKLVQMLGKCWNHLVTQVGRILDIDKV